MSSKRVLFLATSPKTRGGIAAVLRAYSSLPFWKDYHVRWIGTHIDRSAAWKWLYAIKSLVCFLFCIWRYDLIHIHVGELPSMRRKLVFCRIAKVLGKPVIIHLHIGNQLDDYTDNAVCRQLLQQADAIITLSQNIRQKVASRFGVGDKVHVIYKIMFLLEICIQKKSQTCISETHPMDDNLSVHHQTDPNLLFHTNPHREIS